MKAVIDTSSLLSLVRYYLPFDQNNILYNFVQKNVENKEFIILDKVFEECRYVAKGIVIEKLGFLNIKKHLIKTDELLPTKKFFNQVDNQFINQSSKNKLEPVEYDNRRNAFLESADVKLILFGLQNQQNSFENCSIVTEETDTNNDNKSFKKLPSICKMLDINVFTLPELLKNADEINLTIQKK